MITKRPSTTQTSNPLSILIALMNWKQIQSLDWQRLCFILLWEKWFNLTTVVHGTGDFVHRYLWAKDTHNSGKSYDNEDKHLDNQQLND
jgi:hypothetical protein